MLTLQDSAVRHSCPGPELTGPTLPSELFLTPETKTSHNSKPEYLTCFFLGKLTICLVPQRFYLALARVP